MSSVHLNGSRRLVALLLLVIGGLVSCASAPPTMPAGVELFQDQAFAPAAQPPDPGQLFKLSDGMQRYLISAMGPTLHRRGLRQGLLDALYSGQQLRLEYDSAFTRNAAEAFAARSGNCLSLVVMTAAFAKALNLDVSYNRVAIDEQWRLSGDLMMAAGHVNLTLGGGRLGDRPTYDANYLLTIDFLPPAALERQRSTPVDEKTIIGMYMNNRAAEVLAEGRTDEAYWWAREAIVQAPAEIAGYNTLAVIYLRRGLDQAAEKVLKLALARQPDNILLISNLARLMQRQGHEGEYQALTLRLRALEPIAPYRDFRLGQTALREGRYADALVLFDRELSRSPEQPDSHFGLARAYLALGKVDEARKHLMLARDLSSSRGEAALYAAKLGRLPVVVQ